MPVRSLASPFVVLGLLAAVAQADRTITIKNSCDYTIWPAITTYGGDGAITGPRGWEAASGYSKAVTVTDTWNGRVWARRDCSFNSAGEGTCVAGDSGGGLIPTDNTAANANLVEMNLMATSLDWTDISFVPGFTAPVSLTPSDGSPAISCPNDLNPTCPDARMQLNGTDGEIVGCLSACNAHINTPDINNAINCCSGIYNDRTTCLASKVDYYSFFKNGCKAAYGYPFDDDTGNIKVVYTANGTATPDYTIQFCPSGGAKTSGTAVASTSAALTKINIASPSASMSKAPDSMEMMMSMSMTTSTQSPVTSASASASIQATTENSSLLTPSAVKSSTRSGSFAPSLTHSAPASKKTTSHSAATHKKSTTAKHSTHKQSSHKASKTTSKKAKSTSNAHHSKAKHTSKHKKHTDARRRHHAKHTTKPHTTTAAGCR